MPRDEDFQGEGYDGELEERSGFVYDLPETDAAATSGDSGDGDDSGGGDGGDSGGGDGGDSGGGDGGDSGGGDDSSADSD